MKHIQPFRLFESDESTYSFGELSPEAQRNALENNRDINVDYDDWDEGVIEEFKGEMGEIGVDDIKVEYSGFYSQGDGATFSSGDIDTRKLFMAVGIKTDKYLDMDTDNEGIDKGFYDLLDTMEDIGQLDRIKIKPEDIGISMRRSNRSFSVSVDVEILDEPEDWEEPYGFTEDLEEEVTKFLKSKCDDLYQSLEKEYDFLTSDEIVKETLIGNDYEFDEKGNTI